jgi:hypothetical protein
MNVFVAITKIPSPAKMTFRSAALQPLSDLTMTKKGGSAYAPTAKFLTKTNQPALAILVSIAKRSKDGVLILNASIIAKIATNAPTMDVLQKTVLIMLLATMIFAVVMKATLDTP